MNELPSMNDDMFSIRDRIVVVTGGMGRLGREFSLELLRRGARVAVFDTRADAEFADERFGDVATGGNMLFLACDITRRSSIEESLDRVVSQWGVPNGLINNAGLDVPHDAPEGENGPFETYPETSWDKIMEVNVKGVFQCSQVVGGAMAEAGRGSIVNICSVYGLVSPDQRLYEYRRQDNQNYFKPASYAVSKAALPNFSRYLATYWCDQGVRVNTLSPGGVFDDPDPEFLENYAARVPMGRLAHRTEYNGAIVFLLSDASSYMTGSNLVIDGGMTAW